MKKLIRWFKEQIAWFTSKRVLAAINNGCEYEEVKEIVRQEVHR